MEGRIRDEGKGRTHNEQAAYSCRLSITEVKIKLETWKEVGLEKVNEGRKYGFG